MEKGGWGTSGKRKVVKRGMEAREADPSSLLLLLLSFSFSFLFSFLILPERASEQASEQAS